MDRDRDVQMSRAVESQETNGLNQQRSPQQRQRDWRRDQRRREASTHADDEPGSPGARSRGAQDRSSRVTVTRAKRRKRAAAETRPKQKRDNGGCGGLIMRMTASPPTNWYSRDASESSTTSGDESVATAAEKSVEHSGMDETNTADKMLKVRPGQRFSDSDMQPGQGLNDYEVPYDDATFQEDTARLAAVANIPTDSNQYGLTPMQSSTKRPWESAQRINANHDRRDEAETNNLQKRHGSNDAEGYASQGHDASSEGYQDASLQGYRRARAASTRRSRRRSYSFDEGDDDVLQVMSFSSGIDSQNVVASTEVVPSMVPANESASGRELSGIEDVQSGTPGTPGTTGATAMAGTSEPAKRRNRRPSLVTPSNSTGSVVWIGGGGGGVEHTDGEAATEAGDTVSASSGQSEGSVPRIVVTRVGSTGSDGMSRKSLVGRGEEPRPVSLRRGSSGVTPTTPGSGGGRGSEAAKIAAERAVGIYGSGGRNK